MDALECIYTRRSIRAYDSNKPVPDEMIEKILAAAFSAPNAHNARAWDAPLAIAVIIEPNTIVKTKLGYKFQDCAAATQNMLLAARAQGLGSCWMGGFLEPEEIENINQILKIPETKIFFGLTAFGYPLEEKEPRGQIEADKVHYETY